MISCTSRTDVLAARLHAGELWDDVQKTDYLKLGMEIDNGKELESIENTVRIARLALVLHPHVVFGWLVQKDWPWVVWNLAGHHIVKAQKVRCGTSSVDRLAERDCR